MSKNINFGGPGGWGVFVGMCRSSGKAASTSCLPRWTTFALVRPMTRLNVNVLLLLGSQRNHLAVFTHYSHATISLSQGCKQLQMGACESLCVCVCGCVVQAEGGGFSKRVFYKSQLSLVCFTLEVHEPISSRAHRLPLGSITYKSHYLKSQ